ncbi:MAG: hypothetical protein WC269_05025 [Candidatus Gracilibacteria bacterium]|jgi:hypothetical protein
MEDLKKTFDKEPKGKKIVLVSAAAALISTFLPWYSLGFGYSYNAWHSYGFLTVVASIALVLIWLLPKVGVKFKLPVKEDLLEKVLAVVMLAGPVVWVIESNFMFELFGFGIYVALAAGVAAVYFTFVGKKKSTIIGA